MTSEQLTVWSAIREAVAQEREACAKLAERHGETVGERCWNHENAEFAVSKCWQEIAKEIRKRG